LDPKDEKCTFIGYGDNVKGYKLWNPLTHRIIFSRDVIFSELRAMSELEQPKEKDEKVKKVHFDLEQQDAPKEEQNDGLGGEYEEEDSSSSDEDESVVIEEVGTYDHAKE